MSKAVVKVIGKIAFGIACGAVAAKAAFPAISNAIGYQKLEKVEDTPDEDVIPLDEE